MSVLFGPLTPTVGPTPPATPSILPIPGLTHLRFPSFGGSEILGFCRLWVWWVFKRLQESFSEFNSEWRLTLMGPTCLQVVQLYFSTFNVKCTSERSSWRIIHVKLEFGIYRNSTSWKFESCNMKVAGSRLIWWSIKSAPRHSWPVDRDYATR